MSFNENKLSSFKFAPDSAELFIKAVREMREAQRAFFYDLHNSSVVYIRSREEAEEKVDEMLRELEVVENLEKSGE